MLLFTLQDALAAQFADLGGQSAALNFKVVGELLAVKGNVKAVVSCLFGLQHQIGQQLVTGGALGGHLNALVEHNGLGGEILH